jgi:hypothetical protein
MAVLLFLLCPVAAYSQIAGTANLGGPQFMVSAPIPDSDFPAIANRLGLVESPRPAREMSPDDPLFGAPNLIMTPETASHAVETADASGR